MKQLVVISMIVTMWTSFVFGDDVYVATDGSDSNIGSIDFPFATIAKAASVMSAGDTCYIRGGNYYEQASINGLNGSDSQPFVFTNFQDETVTIDGTEAISDLAIGPWAQHSGNIYKRTLSKDIWQLFVNGEMMIMARWPNLPVGMSLWDQDQHLSWAHGDEGLSSVNTVEVDDMNSESSLAGSGLDMTGAMAILNIGSFKTWPRLVTTHSAGSNSFTYNDIPASGYRDKHHYYYMECKLNLLDTEKEWFYDTNDNTLYLWTPGGGLPSGQIQGKTQTYALVVTNSDYVVADGLKFIGTTFSFDDSSNCIVRNAELLYPTCSKRMLGSEADIEYTKMHASSNAAAGNTVYNCTFEKTDGMALGMKGDASVIENNYFHNIDYTCAGLPGLGVTLRINGGDNAVFRRNTIDTVSTSSAISPSRLAVTEYNRITHTGMLQSDGACIHRMVAEAPDSITRYNWIHDTVKYTIRFDGNPAGERGLVHHNAVWNANCMRLKGDWHEIYNNMGFDYTLSSKGNINVATDKHPTPNANSITRNNTASLITDWPLPGTAGNNYNAVVEVLTMRDLLRDVDNHDFRPKTGVPLIDGGSVIAGITDGYVGTAPDIGAYEYGDTHYWIPGRKMDKAATPIPPDGAVNVKRDADLMWLEALDATSHNVYVGSESGNLASLGNTNTNIVTPGSLINGQTYFWRIDALAPGGTVTGDEWSFTVEALPPRFRQITLTPTDDAFVDVNGPNTNFGSSSIVDLKTPEAGNITKQGYLKFDIPDYAGTLTGAVLRFHTIRTNPLQGGADVFGVTDYSWSEDTITWNNQPGIDGAFIVYGTVAASSWGEFDVSSYITANGLYSMGLIRGVAVSNRSVDSKESDFPPELVLTYEVFELSPDIDGNGSVNLIDFALFAAHWQEDCLEPIWCDGADLDLSGIVNIADMKKFAASWLD
ncbi:MAG: DNRLRE domain-containing protein [Phycisphaerae bacterium]|nr:DNRLRE domain-containing protein [Phycisphaerae bacterium]